MNYTILFVPRGNSPCEEEMDTLLRSFTEFQYRLLRPEKGVFSEKEFCDILNTGNIIMVWDGDVPDSNTFPACLKTIPHLIIQTDTAIKNPSRIPYLALSHDFIFIPCSRDELEFRLKNLIRRVEGVSRETIKQNILQEIGFKQVITRSPVFLNELAKIPVLAKYDTTILVTGETGVGKDLVARAIHYLSNRQNKPFIAVNCGAIPSSLIENELYGHKRGAFTDAHGDSPGIISEAQDGTLFLDEIDALGYEAQSALLYLLQNKTFRPVGHRRDIKANIRFICATNKDIKQLMQQRKFREDLFYRFTFSLTIPPLRVRAGDITLIAEYLVRKFASEYERGDMMISHLALSKLQLYHWPGNVRELENVIRKSVVLARYQVIGPEDIDLPVKQANALTSYEDAKRKAIEEFERHYLSDLMLVSNGNISEAARVCKKDRRPEQKNKKISPLPAFHSHPGV